MLQTLQRIIQEINVLKDLDEILTVVATRVCEKLQSDACNIFLINPTTNEYLLHKSLGFDIQSDKPVYLKLGEGLVGMVGERGEPINLEHPSVHPRYFRHPGVKDKAYQARSHLHRRVRQPPLFQR